MAWKEVSPGRFARPFGSLERNYVRILTEGAALNKEHLSITCIIQLHLNLSNPVDALQHAWKTIRYDHPQLAALAQGDTCVYEVPNATSLDAWLVETFVIIPDEKTTDDLCAKFTPTRLATLYYLPRTSQIMLHSSHWRIDGIGMVPLMDRFLEALASPREISFGSEGKRLSLSLEEVLNIPERAAPDLKQAVTDQLMRYVKNSPSIGLPTRPIQSPIPGASRHHRIELPPSLSSVIISASKAYGFSVTTAIHAAIICATNEYADPRIAAKNYTSLLAYDLRMYCPPPYNDSNHPACVYHTDFPATVAPSTLLENAAQLKAMYSTSLTAWDPNPFTYLASYIQQPATLLRPPPHVAPPTRANLSSLGLIDGLLGVRYGQSVEIADFWLGVDILTREVMVNAWTWRGRLSLSACWNDSFYEEGSVRQFLGGVRRALADGLDVETGEEG